MGKGAREGLGAWRESGKWIRLRPHTEWAHVTVGGAPTSPRDPRWRPLGGRSLKLGTESVSVSPTQKGPCFARGRSQVRGQVPGAWVAK